jgi:pilus assembly protein FimV
MIITCNECDTRFNIDKSLLKQTGSKVRCSKCKNVFLAYPSSLSEEPDKSSKIKTELEAVMTDEKIESGIQYKAEEESEAIEVAADEAFKENTRVEEKSEKADLELELDLEPEIDETQAETDEKTEDEEKSSKTFNMGALPDEQEAEKAIEPVDKAEKGALTEKSKPPKVAANKRISLPVLLLLLAAFLISGAYGTYVLLGSVGINIPFVSDLLEPKVQDAGNLKIYTSDINNKFVENSKIGKLLVITGKAKNGYSDARSYISVTGKLYTKGKILSKTKTVYCGTILSELELQNMDLDAINKRLSNRFGDNQSNIQVKANAIILFTVVFADLPENLDEFTIEVAGSFPS